ncbi:MAG: DUF2079 domain-containing protein [Actinobacteria bacterium]|nr:DUF2079 domain-containing protein [Actinomycetota bacterium]
MSADVLTRPPRAQPDRHGWAWAATGSLLFLAVAVRRWSNLKAGASDLGIFDQAIWLMSRGHAPFVTTIGIDVFADHVSAVLLLFVPLYRLAATALWLLVAQSVCLGLAVIPARRLADSFEVGRGWATLFVLANPFIWSAAIYDVHPVVFATPAVAWLLLAVRHDDRRSATIAAILIALCRADTVVVLAGAAILAQPRTRRRLLWLIPVPLIAAQVVPHLLGTWQTFERYYGKLGDSPFDALTHPWRLGLLVPTAALQLLSWLLPVGFLPLRRPRWIAALAVGGLPLLLSSWPGIAEPWWHHGAVMVPFVVGGALAALSPREDPGVLDATGRRRVDQVRIAVGTVAALVLVGPLAPWAPPRVRVPDVLRPAAPAVARAIAEVGTHESVSTSNDAAARLAHRGSVYIFPCPFADAPGSRTCSHPNLYRRAARVDVVVLPGDVDLSWLPGRWTVRHVEGVTIARRAS